MAVAITTSTNAPTERPAISNFYRAYQYRGHSKMVMKETHDVPHISDIAEWCLLVATKSQVSAKWHH